jgi:hypothetical protein
MVKQPEKIEAILKIFKHRALGPAAVEIVASSALADSTRGIAAAYVQEVRFTDGVARLLSIYPSLPPGEARKNALIACAALRPGDVEVVAKLKNLVDEPPGKEKTNTVVGIINILPDIDARPASSGKPNDLGRVSDDLLRYAAAQGLYFELVYSDLSLTTLRPRLDDGDNDDRSFSRQIVQAPPSIQTLMLENESSASLAGNMSVSSLARFDTYWKLLGNFADAGDMKRFRPLLLRSNTNKPENQPRIRVAVSANPDAAMIVVRDQGPPETLFFKSFRKAFVTSTGGWSDPQIIMTWVDDTGEHTGEVTAFKGKGYRFSLEST